LLRRKHAITVKKTKEDHTIILFTVELVGTSIDFAIVALLRDNLLNYVNASVRSRLSTQLSATVMIGTPRKKSISLLTERHTIWINCCVQRVSFTI